MQRSNLYQLELNENNEGAYNHGEQLLQLTEWKSKLPSLNCCNDMKCQQSSGHPTGSTVDSATSAPSDARKVS